jgi:hypothetical protein
MGLIFGKSREKALEWAGFLRAVVAGRWQPFPTSFVIAKI